MSRWSVRENVWVKRSVYILGVFFLWPIHLHSTALLGPSLDLITIPYRIHIQEGGGLLLLAVATCLRPVF